MTGPTPDFPDWATPNVTVELAQVAAALSGLFGRANPALTADVSRWASMNIILAPPGIVPGARYELLLTWSQAGQSDWTDSVTFWDSSDAKLSLGEFMVQLPVRGTSVSFAMRGDNANQSTLTTVLDSRQVDRLSLRRHTTTQPPRLVSQLPVTAVGAGATLGAVHIHPSTDQVNIYVPPCDAHLVYTVSAVQSLIGGMSTVELAQVVGNAAVGQVLTVNAPALGLALVVNNTDVAAHNAAANVWDVT